jgi:HD superfamily phosphodiesterase
LKDIIGERIREAEDRWLGEINFFLEKVFRDVYLPSHDLLHHRHVWQFARNLLHGLAGIRKCPEPAQIEGLLLAAWFHDAGMTLDRGTRSRTVGPHIV